MAQDLVTVTSFCFLPEAEAFRMHLRAEGIPAFLADAETVSMDWLLGNAVGFIKLQVPRSLAERAAELVEDMRARRANRAEESGEGDDLCCLSCGAEIAEDESRCRTCGWSYWTGENN